MPEISVNGETLHYELAGTGPTLAMFHSLGTNGYLWAEQISHWKGRYTCVAFDARGHGRSSNNGSVTMQNVAEDAYAALNEMGLLPAHFIGISMGALQCARFHALEPDAVLSIVYADSFAFLGEAGPARIGIMEEKIASMSMEAFGADYAADTLLPTTAPDQHRALTEAIAGMTKDAYLQTVRSIFTEDVSDFLKRIDKSTHIVVGEHDQRTPLAASESVMALLPGAELVVIPDAAHLANIDNPEGFNAAVDSFFERVPYARKPSGSHNPGPQ